jgi:hypothetical protein
VCRPRIARRAWFAVRIRRVLQCISRFFALREPLELRNDSKFLSEKIAQPSEKIAGIGMLPH